MKPTVGRIVHYYPLGCGVNEGAEHAAIITHVRAANPIVDYADDGMEMRYSVDLCIFDLHTPGSEYCGPPSGTQDVSFSKGPKEGYWTWPPRV